jgi:phosphatidylinositol glycan class W
MNKEGIVSLPGYLAIYLLGLATGQHILRSTRSHEKRKTELALELLGYSVAWWTGLAVLRFTGFEVSRRMVRTCMRVPDSLKANLPYILWTSAYNTTFLFAYLVIEISLSTSVPPLLEAINSNGLVVFLAANVLTGLINLSMRTMWARDSMALLVLTGYSLVTCLIAWTLRNRRLKL